MTSGRSLWRYGILGLSIIVIDQLTKWWALQKLAVPIVVTPFLSFELVLNRGISWGVLHSQSTAAFVAVSASIFIIICFIFWYAYQQWRAQYSIIGETFIIAGALSNMGDRIIHHGVIDFIVLSYKTWSWPVFNLADSYIVFGVMLIFLTAFKKS